MHIESLVAACNKDTVALYDVSTMSFKEIISRLKAIEPPQKSVSGDDQSLMREQYFTSLAKVEHPETTEPWAYVNLDLQQRNSCRRQCYCRCHSQQVSRFRIAPFNSIAGSLSLVYSGFAFSRQHCDIPNCHNFGIRMIEITYSWPRWMLNITVVGGLKIVHGYPTAGLMVKRRITKDMQALSLLDISRFGTVAELKVFLKKYPSSVNDVCAGEGRTVLDYAIGSVQALSNRQYEKVDLLLAFGADPFVADYEGRSAAIMELITLSAQKCTFPFTQGVLPSTTDFDSYGLSHITKVVLGIRPLNLQTELNKDEFYHLINQKDELGLTPLHWAVRISNSLATQRLLKAGADPEIIDPWGYTPLNRACTHISSAPCIEALTMAGADIASRDCLEYLPIHNAAAAGQSDQILSMLITQGSNIQDSNTRFRVTPLSLAALGNRADTCEFLLAQGAQIDSEDWEGDTPLNEAIRSRAHSAVAVLISAGANCLHINSHGHTILHRIGRTGDNATIEILSGVCLTGLNPEAKDDCGCTARDYLQMRVDLPDGFRKAFEQLVERIRCANSQPLREFESDVEDNFVDALENLNFDHGITPRKVG
jgi:ankyrin repeat protein